jgi:hypothetical protein
MYLRYFWLTRWGFEIQSETRTEWILHGNIMNNKRHEYNIFIQNCVVENTLWVF